MCRVQVVSERVGQPAAWPFAQVGVGASITFILNTLARRRGFTARR